MTAIVSRGSYDGTVRDADTVRGYTSRLNSMGILAVRLHYSADPEHDPLAEDATTAARAATWLTAQRISYPDRNDFDREFEINWHVSRGARVFPQFSETYHVRPVVCSPRRVVYRAWDFGYHSPCVLFAQVGDEGRLHALREVVGARQTTREFAEVVVQRSAEWFPLHTPGFEDFCDPAGQQLKSIDSDRNERRDVEVLAGLGIHPRYEYGWSRKDGRSLVHQLLALRTDSTPGFYVDRVGCPILVQAFLGRYVYPDTHKGGQREDPNDDEHPFSDVMASLRYLVTGLHAKLALAKFSAPGPGQLARAKKPSGYGFTR